MNINQVESVLRACELMGSQRALAQALQVSSMTVSQWLRPGTASGRPVPPKQCVRIEQLTQGQVTRQTLRPSDWKELWPELDDVSVEMSG